MRLLGIKVYKLKKNVPAQNTRLTHMRDNDYLKSLFVNYTVEYCLISALQLILLTF